MRDIYWINKNVDVIEESGLPVDFLKSIDITGRFSIERIEGSDDISQYTGKVINSGLIAIEHSESGYPCDMDVYDMTVYNNLIAYNIEGYSFIACTSDHNFEECYEERTSANESKIQNLYEKYKDIIEELKNGVNDIYIQEKYGLSSFKSSYVDSKTKSL